MGSVGAERQWPDPAHGVERKRSIKVRKQGAAARDFVFEGIAQHFSIDGDQNEVVLPGKMLGGCFMRLFGCGEMDETVGKIDRRAVENPGCFGFLP